MRPAEPQAPNAHRRVRVLLVLLVLGAVLAGCDGRNLFQPVAEPPTIVSLTAPSVAALGSPMIVTVRAIGVAPVDSLRFAVEGDVVDTHVDVEIEEPSVDVTRSIEFLIPETIPDDLLTVTVIAVDDEGNESPSRSVSVAILDGIGPDVGGSLGAEAVGQGEVLTVQVSAEDNRGLELVGMRVRDPEGVPLITRVQPVSGAEASVTLAWEVPADQELGTYRIEGYADDVSSNRTVALLGEVLIERRDREPPTVSIQTPESGAVFATDDSVFVQVRIQDPDLFQTVQIQGLSFRGDPDLGTDETVERFGTWSIELDQPVADTTLTRYLSPASDDDTAEPVSIIVTATDLAGNTGADTVDVQVDPDPDADPDGDDGSEP